MSKVTKIFNINASQRLDDQKVQEQNQEPKLQGSISGRTPFA